MGNTLFFKLKTYIEIYTLLPTVRKLFNALHRMEILGFSTENYGTLSIITEV